MKQNLTRKRNIIVEAGQSVQATDFESSTYDFGSASIVIETTISQISASLQANIKY